MVFEDRLIQKGEAGGKEAAGLLWTCVRDYVHQRLPSINSEYKIVARVYANVRGLGDVCNRAGILDNPILMEDFARGFTGSKQLFDFVDVGSGKDRADEKITGRSFHSGCHSILCSRYLELFKLNLLNVHCRHIFFGCSHDNGYARLLEDVPEQYLTGITLLEGVPFEKELAIFASRSGSAKFDDLFRTSKINVYTQPYQQPIGPPAVPQQLPQSNSISQMLPSPVQQNGQTIDPNQIYQSPYQPATTRSPSTSSSVAAPMNPTATSWASKAVAAPPAQVASPPPTPQPAKEQTIPRNKYGQRVDSIPKYDASELNRVKKIKMCNVHYLRNDCPYGDECTHDHFYKPNKNELETLRFVARQTPCRFGTACDDVKCIYGHRWEQSFPF
jgi:hypothetical protein